MSINAIGTDIPIEVVKGGLGVATLTQFGVLYGNGVAPVGVTAVGTALNVLTSNGPGLAPTFQPLSIIPGGGAWTLIQTQTAAASPSLIFNTGLSSSYPNLIFIVSGLLSDTNADTCVMEVSLNGGATWALYPAGGQGGPVAYIVTGGTTWIPTANSFSTIQMSSAKVPTTGSGLSGTYYYFGSNVNVNYQRLRGEWSMFDSDGVLEFGLANGFNQAGSTTTVNAFRIRMLAGNIASGVVSLYGLRNS